jgi:hypothetical protein
MRKVWLFLLLIAPSLAAQVPLERGSWVRLIHAENNEPRSAGAIVSVGGDSVAVEFGHRWRTALSSDVRQFPKSRIELLTATRRRTKIGMAIGAPALAVAGYLWGMHGFGVYCDYGCSKDRTMVAPLTVVGGLAGLAAGAIVGHQIKLETWTPLVARP